MDSATFTAITADTSPGPPLSPGATNILGAITIGIIVLIVVLCIAEAFRR